MKATITERGNGFPSVGQYVSSVRDGNIYRVTAIVGRIQTHGPGQGNTIEAEVEMADWTDIDDETEPRASCVLVTAESCSVCGSEEINHTHSGPQCIRYGAYLD